ncbi:MAG: hypothetical protein ABSG62_16120 [Terracidiphilus sp.]|jgi:hypothetical protein
MKITSDTNNTTQRHWRCNGLFRATENEGEMKIHRQRYQTGTVREVPRAHGFAREFRYHYTDTNGQRKLKVQTFDAAIYKTERDVRNWIEAQLASLNANTLAGRAGVTFGQIIDRYLTFISIPPS